LRAADITDSKVMNDRRIDCDRVGLAARAAMLSVAVTVKLNDPAADGVPLHVPSLLSVKPVGVEPVVTAKP